MRLDCKTGLAQHNIYLVVILHNHFPHKTPVCGDICMYISNLSELPYIMNHASGS